MSESPARSPVSAFPAHNGTYARPLVHAYCRICVPLPAVDGLQLLCVVMAVIDTVWHRIIAYSGEAFHPEHGNSFTYSVSGDTVYLDTANQNLSRSQIAVAFTRMPLSHPVQLSDLAGPSYIYTILTDPRITGDGLTYRSPAFFG